MARETIAKILGGSTLAFAALDAHALVASD
jgi:hypothetical protein